MSMDLRANIDKQRREAEQKKAKQEQEKRDKEELQEKNKLDAAANLRVQIANRKADKQAREESESKKHIEQIQKV